MNPQEPEDLVLTEAEVAYGRGLADGLSQRATGATLPASPEKLIDDLLAKTFEFIGMEEDDELGCFPGRGLRRMRDHLRRLQESEPVEEPARRTKLETPGE